MNHKADVGPVETPPMEGRRSGADPPQVSPVQQVRQPLGAVALDDALTTRLLTEAEHELSQLVTRVLSGAETPVHDVDA